MIMYAVQVNAKFSFWFLMNMFAFLDFQQNSCNISPPFNHFFKFPNFSLIMLTCNHSDHDIYIFL